VFSATALHWVDPNLSYSKTASLLLGDDGCLALLTTPTLGEAATPMSGSARRFETCIAGWRLK
jgi:hypothetical protein